MKKGAVLLLLLLPVIFVACGGVSATQVERELYSKLDQGDVAGALALTTEDAVFDIPGCPEGGCKGKDAVKGAFERVVAQHPRHTVKSSKDSGNTATSQVEDELDLAKAAGVQRIVAKVAVELKGDKIARFRAQFDTTDPQTATAANFARLSGILRQLYEASSKGDVAATAAFFTDDAVLVRGACTFQVTCVGTAAIKLQLEREQTNQSRVVVISLQVSGDTATGRVEVRGLNIKNAGQERVIENFTATFKGDKITQLVHELDLSDSQSAALTNWRRVAQIITRYSDALNLGNVAGAMAALTDDAVDDAVIEGYGLCAAAPCAGKAAIQKEVEQREADKTKATGIAGTLRVTGDTRTSRAEVRSDSIKAAGVERIIVAQMVETKGDKVSLIRSVPDSTDPQTATYLKSLTR